MLEAARRSKALGADVVVGCVVTHGRVETEALLDGLEALPLQTVEHQGVKLEEFGLEAALRRKPGMLLVDELAHTNAPAAVTRSDGRTCWSSWTPASTCIRP
jgi:two-component system sensor histidine kinase KdpD